MVQFFNLVLYQPLFNLLVFFYNIVPGQDLGLAIIALTIVLKFLLLPFSWQSIKSQQALQELAPQLEELKRRYKDNREKMARETMRLYKENKVNPLSSCLPLLIQLPFLIAIFQVFQKGLDADSLRLLYPFVSPPGSLNAIAFGMLDLSKPHLLLALLAGLSQFWQAKTAVVKKPMIKVRENRDERIMVLMNQQMVYLMPIMTVVISLGLPSGLALHWTIMTLLTIFQQNYYMRKITT